MCAETFTFAVLSDETFFDADADPVELARQLRSRLPAVSARSWLGEAGDVLNNRLLDECCRVYAGANGALPLVRAARDRRSCSTGPRPSPSRSSSS